MFDNISEFTSIVNDGDKTTFITLMQNPHCDIKVAIIVCAFVKECFGDMSWLISLPYVK